MGIPGVSSRPTANRSERHRSPATRQVHRVRTTAMATGNPTWRNRVGQLCPSDRKTNRSEPHRSPLKRRARRATTIERQRLRADKRKENRGKPSGRRGRPKKVGQILPHLSCDESKRTAAVAAEATGMSRERHRKVKAGGRKRLVTVGRKQLGANCPKLIQDVRRLATIATTKSLRANFPMRSRVWPNNRDRNATRKLRSRQTLPRGNRYRQAI